MKKKLSEGIDKFMTLNVFAMLGTALGALSFASFKRFYEELFNIK